MRVSWWSGSLIKLKGQRSGGRRDQHLTDDVSLVMTSASAAVLLLPD